MNLDELGLHHQTDKASTYRGRRGNDYCRVYEHEFAALRDHPIRLLELGVRRGASLRMWRDWFRNAAVIVGLDRHRIDVEGCVVIGGEQNDPAAIDAAAQQGPFDVIIDDASHVSSLTITSFHLLYPHLRGTYVIEDIVSSYRPVAYGLTEASLNPTTPTPTAMNFCKRLADEVNAAGFPETYRLGYHIESVTFYRNMCFIRNYRENP